MSLNRVTAATTALAIAIVFPGAVRAFSAPAPNPQGYGQYSGGWDAPPRDMKDIQQRGFRDGIVGAQKDFDNHRRPDPNNRDEYRKPNVPRDQWDAYREGFRLGYQRGVAHLTGQNQPPMQGAYPGAPGPVPGGGYGSREADVRQRGFRDGMDGALKDLDNNRRPDPNNRDEYRKPNVPGGLQDVYRDGFRSGYQQAMDALTGSFAGGHGHGPGQDIRQRGYRDGAAGAIRDFDNNRPPDPNNRDEYRNPNVPRDMQSTYRDAFAQGYRRIASAMSGYSGRR